MHKTAGQVLSGCNLRRRATEPGRPRSRSRGSGRARLIPAGRPPPPWPRGSAYIARAPGSPGDQTQRRASRVAVWVSRHPEHPLAGSPRGSPAPPCLQRPGGPGWGSCSPRPRGAGSCTPPPCPRARRVPPGTGVSGAGGAAATARRGGRPRPCRDPHGSRAGAQPGVCPARTVRPCPCPCPCPPSLCPCSVSVSVRLLPCLSLCPCAFQPLSSLLPLSPSLCLPPQFCCPIFSLPRLCPCPVAPPAPRRVPVLVPVPELSLQHHPHLLRVTPSLSEHDPGGPGEEKGVPGALKS